MVADYSAVEARGVMWLADDEEALEMVKHRETAFFHAKSLWDTVQGDVA